MTTEKKKALLTDVRDANRALGRILDGGHDLNQLATFPASSVKALDEVCLSAMAGLTMLDQLLTAEIGTDNL
jgi:hypothetical protein